MRFFNVDFAPAELFDLETARFYAWSSLTEDGEVVAWDYAPDTGWLSAPQRERLGCLAKFPRTRRALGRMVRALNAWLSAHPSTNELRHQTWWLEPVG